MQQGLARPMAPPECLTRHPPPASPPRPPAGLQSTARGRKGAAPERCATPELGCAYVGLEYRGHGASGGDLARCGLGDWAADVALALRAAAGGRRALLVGSSIGAWLALHAALAAPAPHPVAGLLLVAPAVDASLRWQAEARPAGAEDLALLPSPYVFGGGILVGRRLIADANQGWLLLDAPGKLAGLASGLPVHILHGERDDVVPLAEVRALAAALAAAGADVRLEVIPGGDHRLSRDEDLARILAALRGLQAAADAAGGTELGEKVSAGLLCVGACLRCRGGTPRAGGGL